jgi:pimeloyl-ACP methyl ester carboxylesterase
MSPSQPVIVLVHGAWADASSWTSVISELQRRGFTVYAPPNPLRGLPQDSAYLHQFLTQNAALQGQPVVLVGHSYGGAVVTNAAVGAPGVRALVYVDAFIPEEGDTIGGLASAEPGSCLGNEAFNPVPASQAAVIAGTQRPLTASAFTEPSGPPAWKTIPSWAVIGTGDQVIPPAELTFMAKRAGAHITDVNAGHLSLVSEPSVVIGVILQAVQATG